MGYFSGAVSLEVPVPETYKQAVYSPLAKEWLGGIREELDSLNKNNTWKLMPLPAGRKALKSKWVFATKEKNDGSLRYKARLVIKGFMQVEGLDYQETFAPVIKMQSICIILSIANHRKMLIHQMDVKTAFLNGYLEEDIYMEQPVLGLGQPLLSR